MIDDQHQNLTTPATYPINAHSGQNQPDNFDEIFEAKAYLGKIFEGEMVNRTLPTTLLEIFCKSIFNSKINVKSPDNNI